MALITLGMTTSYFAAAPILSEIVGRDLLAPQAVEARKRALLDFLDHGVDCAKGANRRNEPAVKTLVVDYRAWYLLDLRWWCYIVHHAAGKRIFR